MVQHVIIWKIKSEYTEEEKNEVRAKTKSSLEALAGKINGLVSIKVVCDLLPSSNGDMMLLSTFEDKAALGSYQINPLHIAAATYIRANVENRFCVDYEE